jgi:hypothetical protein
MDSEEGICGVYCLILSLISICLVFGLLYCFTALLAFNCNIVYREDTKESTLEQNRQPKLDVYRRVWAMRLAKQLHCSGRFLSFTHSVLRANCDFS